MLWSVDPKEPDSSQWNQSTAGRDSERCWVNLRPLSREIVAQVDTRLVRMLANAVRALAERRDHPLRLLPSEPRAAAVLSSAWPRAAGGKGEIDVPLVTQTSGLPVTAGPGRHVLGNGVHAASDWRGDDATQRQVCCWSCLLSP